MTPTLTFWGAARSVTGSMHLVEHAGQQILLDCGTIRSPRHPGHPEPAGFPFAPESLAAAVVSHAHMDHCGNLPALVRQGFRGPVYCTPATRDLLALVLAHSARIQEDEAHVAQVVAGPLRGDASPRFRRGDVARLLEQCVALPYDERREIAEGVELHFADAAHILGSAMVGLTFGTNGAARRLTFTGDLGRFGSFLLRDPSAVPDADLLVSESTYGGRALDSVAQARAALEDVVRRTIGRGGKVLIPAFSLGRTQVVLFALQEAMRAGRLPSVPVYVDSPLAADIVEVYRRHPPALHPDALSCLDGGTVHYLRTPDESRAASESGEPAILIAPSGMCEGGRILHHLKRHIDDPRCTVVLVNYQAPHTPGARLLERGPTVRFHGKKWNKWADVVYLAGFSGHADHGDLIRLLGRLSRQTRVRLVHGEPAQAEALGAALRTEGFGDVAIPERGCSVPV